MLRAIIEHKRTHDGNSPAIRQLQAATGLKSTSAVFYHLDRLQRAGLIRLDRFKSRGIEVVGGSWSPPPGPTP